MQKIARLIGALADPRVERRALLTVFVVAAVVRLAMAPLVARQLGYLPDILTYRNAATELLAKGSIGSDLVMPGYPVLVLLSGGALGQLLLDVALSVVSVWCVARLARTITDSAVAGLFAALIWTFYPFSIFYAVVGLTENAFVTFVLLGFLAYQHGRFAWGSAALVAAIMIRPAIEIVAPLLLLTYVLAVHRLSFGRALAQLGILAAVYAAMMSPWWWHNYQKYGEFVRLNLGGGMVLYSGNYPGNRDGGGVEFSIDVPGFHDIASPVERDRVLRDEALRFIAENPRRFAELAVLKFVRLWQPWPHASEYAGSVSARLAAASILPVMALAIAGAAGGVRRYGWSLGPIGLYIAYLTAIHMVTIASLRYRFPMEPFLAVLAALPFARLDRAASERAGA